MNVFQYKDVNLSKQVVYMCLRWTFIYNTSYKLVELLYMCLGWNTDSLHVIDMDGLLIKMKQYLIFVL
jgi:hypothetical protein